MPDPDRLLRTIRQAIRAFQDTPGRRGHVVALGDPVDVLVAGDLHGHLENFRRILNKAALGQNARRHLVLQELVHGTADYPAGGDKSHQLLDLLAALKCQYPRQVHMLLGNHELSEWTGRRIAKSDREMNAVFRQGIETAYGARAAEVYAAYQALFAAMAWAVRTPNRVFLSHSLPPAARLEQFDPAALEREGQEEKDLLPGGVAHSLVWGRDTAPATAAAFLVKVDADLLISGHIPCDEGFVVPNDRQLILDAMKSPACYCLFPADRPVTLQDLVGCVGTL